MVSDNPKSPYLINVNPKLDGLGELDPALFGDLNKLLGVQPDTAPSETRTSFTDEKQILGSSYMLGRLNLNPEYDYRFLGDAAFDTRYVSNTLLNQTGNRYLNGVGSDLQQMQYLMDSAAAQQKSLGLQFSVALTRDQIASLDKSILWWESATVNGETVMIPKLYLSPKDVTVNNGSVIAGNNVSLKGGDITNSGSTLLARQDLKLDSQNSISNLNDGLMKAGGGLSLSAIGDINNISSAISGKTVAQVRQAEDTFMAVGQTLDDVRTAVGAGQATTYHSYLVRLKARQPLLDGLYFYNAQGVIKGSSSGISGIPGDITHKDYFRFHSENRQTGIHIGRVIKSLASDELVIPVSVRVNDLSGGFAGVVLATVKLDYFRRFYSYFELIRADRGTGTWVASLDHIERVFGFARTEKLPLVVVAGYDREEVRMHWLRNNLPGLLSNFMLLLGFLLFSSVVFRKVRSSIRDQQELKQLRDELLKANQTFKSMAMADSLTGLANRRKFDTTLASVLADSASSGSPVSLIMLDID